MKKVYAIICAMAIAAILIFFMGMPYLNLQKANRLFDEKEYTQALEVYQTVSGYYTEDGLEGARKCKYRLADAAIFDGDYDAAIALYTELGDDEKLQEVGLIRANDLYEAGEYKAAAEVYDLAGETVKAGNAWLKYGDQCMEAEDYENAVAAYANVNNTGSPAIPTGCLTTPSTKERLARKKWAAALVEQKEYVKAEAQYQLVGDEESAWNAINLYMLDLIAEQREDEVLPLIKDYTGPEVAQRVYDAVISKTGRSPDAEANAIARKYGSNLTDTDTQLAYCELLRAEGYSMKEVYPDGVIVNADLSKFQFFEMALSDSEEIDPSKVLIFSREEPKPALDGIAIASEEEADKQADLLIQKKETPQYQYEVRLQPGQMDEYPEENRALTLADGTALILLEKGYYPDYQLTIRTEHHTNGYVPGVPSLSSLLPNYHTDPYTYSVYFGYMAYEAIAIYNMNNPLAGTYAEYYVADPLIADSVVGNRYTDRDLNLSSQEIDAILAALEAPERPENAKLLSKYSPEIIDFVSENGWGTYIYIPEPGEDGKENGKTYSSDERYKWNVEKYMLGAHEDGWLFRQLQNDVMENVRLYLLYYLKLQ